MKFRDYIGYSIMCAGTIAAFVLLLLGAPESSFAWVVGATILGFVIQLGSFWRNRPAILATTDARVRYRRFVERSLESNKSFEEIERHITMCVDDQQLRDELLLDLNRARNSTR